MKIVWSLKGILVKYATYVQAYYRQNGHFSNYNGQTSEVLTTGSMMQVFGETITWEMLTV
jgi:hypothetical protein